MHPFASCMREHNVVFVSAPVLSCPVLSVPFLGSNRSLVTLGRLEDFKKGDRSHNEVGNMLFSFILLTLKDFLRRLRLHTGVSQNRHANSIEC